MTDQTPTDPATPRTRTEWTWRHNQYTSTASATTDRDAALRKVNLLAANNPGDDVALLTRTVTDWTEASAALPGSSPRTQESVDVDRLIANVERSLAAAQDNDERTEAIETLLVGWHAAWPDSAVTDPHTPLADQLVRLLAGPPTTAPAVADDVLAAWIERAIDNPWSIVGRRLLQPSWVETTVEHAARAVMAVVRDGGHLVCERCDRVILPTEELVPPLPGIGLWQHDGCPTGDPRTDQADDEVAGPSLPDSDDRPVVTFEIPGISR